MEIAENCVQLVVLYSTREIGFNIQKYSMYGFSKTCLNLGSILPPAVQLCAKTRGRRNVSVPPSSLLLKTLPQLKGELLLMFSKGNVTARFIICLPGMGVGHKYLYLL